MFVILFSSSLLGNDEPIVRLIVKETGKTLRLNINHNGEGAEIRIIDDNSKTHYFQRCMLYNYTHEFDFQEFPQGNYFFSIKVKQKFFEYYFKIEETSLALLRNKEVVKHRLTIPKKEEGFKKWIIQLRKNRLCLSLLNPEKKPVTVKIYNPNGDLTHQDSFRDRAKIERSYNFETALLGSYEIIVRQGNKTFRKIVKNQK